MPMVPAHAGPRSERISPNRFDATTTSNRFGCSTKRAHRMSMCCLSQVISGHFAAINAVRSSQYGMLMDIPLDLVAAVSRLRGRVCQFEGVLENPVHAT